MGNSVKIPGCECPPSPMVWSGRGRGGGGGLAWRVRRGVGAIGAAGVTERDRIVRKPYASPKPYNVEQERGRVLLFLLSLTCTLDLTPNPKPLMQALSLKQNINRQP